jgi:hypothetical protein
MLISWRALICPRAAILTRSTVATVARRVVFRRRRALLAREGGFPPKQGLSFAREEFFLS